MTSLALVVAQFAALAVLAWPWHAGAFDRWGLVPIAAGAIVAGWALAAMKGTRFSVLPEPARDASLVVTGPYARVRHPMYAGVLLGAIGCVIGWSTWLHAVAGIVLFAVLLLKVRREERLLAARFPAYAGYAARTPRFVPHVVRRARDRDDAR